MTDQPLSREQVDEALRELCGLVSAMEFSTDGAADSAAITAKQQELLAHDAALRADLTMKNEENNSLLAQMVTLRAENERLRQQVVELQQAPAPSLNITPLVLQMDVDVKAVNGFIRNLMTGTVLVEWYQVESLQCQKEIVEAKIIRLAVEHDKHVSDLTARLASVDAELAKYLSGDYEGQPVDAIRQLIQVMITARDNSKEAMEQLATVTQERDALKVRYQDCCDDMNERRGWVGDLEKQLAERDATILALAQEGLTAGDTIARLTDDLRSRTEDWQYSEQLLHTANRAFADMQARVTTLEAALRDMTTAARRLVCVSPYHFEGNDVDFEEAIEAAKAALQAP